MKKYTLKQIKDLPCMKMETSTKSQWRTPPEQIRNKHRHQLLEEMKGEGKCQ